MDTTDLPRLGELTNRAHQNQMTLAFCQWLACLGETGGAYGASKHFLARWPQSPAAPLVRLNLEQKSVVSAGSTTDPNWAAPLAAPAALQDAFVALARGESLIGRIKGLRRVPFNVRIPVESSGASYQWVAEGAPKPATAMAFNNGPTLAPLKLAAIPSFTRELIELSIAGMEGALKDALLAKLTEDTDKNFLDPSLAAIAGKNPASITSGVTPISSTGDYSADVQTLLTAFFSANPNTQNAVLITNAGHAAQIRSWNAGGGVGVDVLVSSAALNNTVALDPRGIVVADAGLEIAVSDRAAMQMDSAPDAPPTAASVLVSAFQMNLVFFRVERTVNWAVAVPGSVKYLAG